MPNAVPVPSATTTSWLVEPVTVATTSSLPSPLMSANSGGCVSGPGSAMDASATSVSVGVARAVNIRITVSPCKPSASSSPPVAAAR